MSTATQKSKKRKRQEKLQQYGVDLPEIPGVPVEIIPVLVHALKVATKFFQHESSRAFNEDWEEEEEEETVASDDSIIPRSAKRSAWESHGANAGTGTGTGTGDALDTVLNRLDSAVDDTEERKQQQQE